MMCDIERIATEPTAEDRAYLPEIAGCGDALGALKNAWANYRDDSFIAQYLSPHLMRKMRLFKLENRAAEPALQGRRHPRRARLHARCGARWPASTTPACAIRISRSPPPTSPATAGWC